MQAAGEFIANPTPDIFFHTKNQLQLVIPNNMQDKLNTVSSKLLKMGQPMVDNPGDFL